MEKCIPESQETPEYEAKSHSKKFLKRAAKLADRKLGSRKYYSAKKASKKYAKKRG